MADDIPSAEGLAAKSPVPSRSLFRRALGPLLLYHVLLLVGAFLLIGGVIGGLGWSLTVGWVLVGIGIAVQIAVLVWAARMIRSEPAAGRVPVSRTGRSDGDAVGDRWFCVGCGWKGAGGPRFCPRCGRVAIRRPTLPPADRVVQAERSGPPNEVE